MAAVEVALLEEALLEAQAAEVREAARPQPVARQELQARPLREAFPQLPEQSVACPDRQHLARSILHPETPAFPLFSRPWADQPGLPEPTRAIRIT